MDINELTLGQIKQLTQMVNQPVDSNSFEVGKNVFIQTVTHYYTGRVAKVTSFDLILEDAAWIADTGRFSNAMEAVDNLAEVEPIPFPYCVTLGSIVGFGYPNWKELPRTQK
jgi:hypothetical protein